MEKIKPTFYIDNHKAPTKVIKHNIAKNGPYHFFILKLILTSSEDSIFIPELKDIKDIPLKNEKNLFSF